METFEPPKYIASLIAAINDGAKSAQLGALAFTAIGLFLLATAFSATDEDLLLNHAITISQLGGAQVPVVATFGLAPAIFVAAHFYTLIRYDMLAGNLRYFKRELQRSVELEEDRERCRQLLANVEFVNAMVMPDHARSATRLSRLTVWFLTAFFPIMVLLIVQLSSLRLQHTTVNWTQRIFLFADLALLVWFFPRRKEADTWNFRTAPLRRKFRLCLVPAIIFICDFSWFNVPAADSTTVGRTLFEYAKIDSQQVSLRDILSNLRMLTVGAFSQPIDLLICRSGGGFGCRFLTVAYRPIVDKVWDAKTFVDMRANGTADEQHMAAIERANLRGRMLRFAVLTGSELYGADLTDASLEGAHLSRTKFARAIFDGAHLEGAILANAHLEYAKFVSADMESLEARFASFTGASLFNANLSGAELDSTNFEGSDFSLAQLKGASLRGSHLENANFGSADMEKLKAASASFTGANLANANLSNAELGSANFEQAKLHGAKLFGADLRFAQLQAADLAGVWAIAADLSAADLDLANLYVANLQGAKLIRTHLAGANLYSADLSGANIFGARLEGADLTDAHLWNVTSRVPDKSFGKARDPVNLGLANLGNIDLSPPQRGWQSDVPPDFPQELQGRLTQLTLQGSSQSLQNVEISASAGPALVDSCPVRAFPTLDCRQSTQNQADYDLKLAAFLAAIPTARGDVAEKRALAIGLADRALESGHTDAFGKDLYCRMLSLPLSSLLELPSGTADQLRSRFGDCQSKQATNDAKPASPASVNAGQPAKSKAATTSTTQPLAKPARRRGD